MTARSPTTSDTVRLVPPNTLGVTHVERDSDQSPPCTVPSRSSAFGLATTSPNPPVGCVVLSPAGRIVGEGYHARKGEAHAEAKALAAAGGAAAGGTAVVTLEPCNHHGRTPPCHQALIDARISRVVIAVLDPTSRARRRRGACARPGCPSTSAFSRTRRCSCSARGSQRYATNVPRSPGPTTSGRTAIARCPTTSHRSPDSPVRLRRRTARGTGLWRTRSLLLNGGAALAKPFLDSALIDEVRLYLSSRAPIEAAQSVPLDWPLLPPGFHLRHLRKLKDLVVIEAARRADASNEAHGRS